jgi:hypothetical protein
MDGITAGPVHTVRLNPLGISVTIWPIVPAMDDDDECVAVVGMSGKENRSSQYCNVILSNINIT